jgi:hypothetical protein
MICTESAEDPIWVQRDSGYGLGAKPLHTPGM